VARRAVCASGHSTRSQYELLRMLSDPDSKLHFLSPPVPLLLAGRGEKENGSCCRLIGGEMTCLTGMIDKLVSVTSFGLGNLHYTSAQLAAVG